MKIEDFTKDVYSAQEVAVIIGGVSSRTVRRYIDAGHFPNAYRPGTTRNAHWRIPKEDLIAYLKVIGRLK